MWRDADRDQEIAGGMAGRGLALSLKPDLLTGGNACGNPDIEFLAGRQPDTLFRALDRFFQRHRHGNAEIEIERDPARIELEGIARAGPRTAHAAAAEHAVEDVLEAATAKAARTGAAGAEGAGFKSAAGGGPARPRIATGKTLEARLALGVDFAAIELLALVLVADDLVGRVQLGKARLGFRIVLVGIGVMLLGKLAIGALDRRSAGAPRHPQDLIGVAHPSRLLLKRFRAKWVPVRVKKTRRNKGNSDIRPRAARPHGFHLGASWHFCNGVSIPTKYLPLAPPPRL